MAVKKANQEVVITLSNGTKGVFTGRAIAWPGQCDGVTVTDVKFFAPKLAEKKKEKVSQSAAESTPGSPST